MGSRTQRDFMLRHVEDEHCFAFADDLVRSIHCLPTIAELQTAVLRKVPLVLHTRST